jgi:arylformamidase
MDRTMFFNEIDDWDDAYANIPNIPNGEEFPKQWARKAAAFRSMLSSQNRFGPDHSYGAGARNRYDLFLPGQATQDVLVFVHGGYWMRFDTSDFSHLANGCLENGVAVAMPAYSLCPDAHIRDITRDIGRAIEAVSRRFNGRIYLAGHSAGGHLVTRMVCDDSPLSTEVQVRIRRVMSISGVHDLRPLVRLELNRTLNLDEQEAAAESPVLRVPIPGTELICFVGASERSEFIRQNRLLANIWFGLGARTIAFEQPDRHHMNVIDGLANPGSQMLQMLLE